jgi:hypothetical protein
MVEKRRFPRFECKLKTKFNFYEGNPDGIEEETGVLTKGKGIICDISQGGALLITSTRVAAGVPSLIQFKTKKNKHSVQGRIVRTGILKNNPTEVAQKMARFASFGDSYIAIEFKDPIELSEDDL